MKNYFKLTSLLFVAFSTMYSDYSSANRDLMGCLSYELEAISTKNDMEEEYVYSEIPLIVIGGANDDSIGEYTPDKNDNSRFRLYEKTDFEYCNSLSKDEDFALEIARGYIDCPADEEANCANFEKYVESRIDDLSKLAQMKEVKLDTVNGLLSDLKNGLAASKELQEIIQARHKILTSVLSEEDVIGKSQNDIIVANKAREPISKSQVKTEGKPKESEQDVFWFKSWLLKVWASFISWVVSVINFFSRIF